MNRSDIFLSYRRKDKEFTQKLDQAFKAKGLEVWVDWEDIPPGSIDFTTDILEGIEGADVFVPVLTPNYLESPYCMGEMDEAIKLHKRIVPVVLNKFDVEQIPPAVATVNWVYFTPHVGDENKFEDAFPVLMEAIQLDQEHVAAHTRYLLRAKEWDKNNRDGSFLLNGSEIDDAEAWLATSGDKEPHPITLHNEYVFASRAQQRAQQRRLLTGVAVALVVSVALTIISVLLFRQSLLQQAALEAQQAELIALNDDLEVQRQQAETAAAEAQSLLWATYALEALDNDNTLLAIPLALQATTQEIISAPPPLSQRALAEAAYAPGARYLFDTDSDARLWGMGAAPDGTTLATGGADGMLTQWRSNGAANPNWQVQAHAGSVWDVAYHPEGDYIATAGADGEARLWDTETGEALGTLEDHGSASLWNLVFSPDGALLAGTGIGGEVYVWDTTTEDIIQTLESGNDVAWALAFSEDGTQLAAAGSEPVVTLWNVPDFEQILQTDPQPSELWSLVFNIDGSELFLGEQDGAIRMIRTEDGSFGGRVDVHTDRVLSLDLSPDGRQLVSSSADGTVAITSIGRDGPPTVVDVYEGHLGAAWEVIYTSEAGQLVSVSADSTMIVWDTTGGAVRRVLTPAHIQAIGTVAVSPDGTYALTGGNDRRIIKNMLDGEESTQFETEHIESVNDVVISPDGTQALSAGDTRAILWDVETGTLLRELLGHVEEVQAVAFHPEEPIAVSAGTDMRIIIWDLETGDILREYGGHSGTIWDIAFDETGARFATVGSDRDVVIWDFESGEELLRFADHEDAVTAVAFHPNGELVASAGADRVVILHELNREGVPGDLRYTAHTDTVTDVMFSPEGDKLVTTSQDGLVIVWDLLGNPIRRYDAHDGQVLSAAFDPTNSSSFVSVGADKRVILWRADPLDALQEWTIDNRAVRDFTCLERELFQLPPIPVCMPDDEAVEAASTDSEVVAAEVLAGS